MCLKKRQKDPSQAEIIELKRVPEPWSTEQLDERGEQVTIEGLRIEKSFTRSMVMKLV